MATNHSMDQDTRASHSKAQDTQAFWSKVFLCRLLECYRGHLAEPKTVKKRYFAKKKKTKQHRTKKGDEKKTAKLICCGNARLDLW